MKLVLNGRGGKVGHVLAPALEEAGHEFVELDDAEAMVDFTAPDAVEENVRAAIERGVPCVIGTAEVISSVTKRVLSSYHRQMYAGGNVVIAAAGNIEHNKFLRMLQRAQSQQRPPAGGLASDARS